MNNSYNDCIQNELLGSFHDILGCQPPLLGKDLDKMCNQRFNLSKAKEKKLVTLFMPLHHHDLKFKCKTPCKTNKYTKTLLYAVPYKEPLLVLVFDKTIEVARSTFSINSQTLLTRLGGSVSSGRTLLWILLTLLGASQVNFKFQKMWPVEVTQSVIGSF